MSKLHAFICTATSTLFHLSEFLLYASRLMLKIEHVLHTGSMFRQVVFCAILGTSHQFCTRCKWYSFYSLCIWSLQFTFGGVLGVAPARYRLKHSCSREPEEWWPLVWPLGQNKTAFRALAQSLSATECRVEHCPILLEQLPTLLGAASLFQSLPEII